MIYGLDLSIANTGVAILDENQNVVYVGSINTLPKDSTGVRLNTIREFLLGLMQQYPPKIICIERGFSRFHNATQVLYQVHGVAAELFHEFEQVYYTPNHVKKCITGDGHANKAVVMDSIKEMYPNVKVKNYDEADALAIASVYFGGAANE